METLQLQVTQGQYPNVKAARAADRVPMVYYGKGVENANFSADYQDFRRVFAKGGRSTIVNLKNENGKEFPVLVHEIQYHPVSDRITHVDVVAVNMNQALHTEIPLVFVGVSPAVKEQAGTLVISKDVVNVSCLPKDLVHEINVDISSLVDFHTSLTVADIKAPAGITILDAPDVNLANVSAPRDIDAEEAALASQSAEQLAAIEAAKAAEAAAKAAPAAEGAPKAKSESKKD